MRTIEVLDGIQEQARQSLTKRELPDLLRRAKLTGSISGVRHHPDIAKAILVAGGLLIAVTAGVTVIHSNMGGAQGLEDRASQLVHMVNR